MFRNARLLIGLTLPVVHIFSRPKKSVSMGPTQAGDRLKQFEVVILGPMDPGTVGLVFQAALTWNAAVGSKVMAVTRRQAPSPNLIVVTDQPASPLGQILPNGGKCIGFTQIYGTLSAVTLDRGLNRCKLLAAAVHELGHAMGLEHEDDVRSIMNPVLVNCDEQKISDTSIKQLRPARRRLPSDAYH
jgi:hypothetical protein